MGGGPLCHTSNTLPPVCQPLLFCYVCACVCMRVRTRVCMCVFVNVQLHSVLSPFKDGLQSRGGFVSACCLCLCVCCCCICPCCGTHCGRGSYRSCSPALLAEKNSHDSALKKLPGSPFTAGCAETLGWSVFVLAPLLVVTLTLKHLTFPAELRQRIMPARLKQPETDSDGDQHIKCNMVN